MMLKTVSCLTQDLTQILMKEVSRELERKPITEEDDPIVMKKRLDIQFTLLSSIFLKDDIKSKERDANRKLKDNLENKGKTTEADFNKIIQHHTKKIVISNRKIGKKAAEHIACHELIAVEIKFAKDVLSYVAIAVPRLIYIFDTFTCSKLISYLGPTLEDKSITKVMYDYRKDRNFLYKTFGIALMNVFDLQIAYREFQEGKKFWRKVSKDTLISKYKMPINDPIIAAELLKWEKYNPEIYLERPFRKIIIEATTFSLFPMFDLYQRLKIFVKDDKRFQKICSKMDLLMEEREREIVEYPRCCGNCLPHRQNVSESNDDNSSILDYFATESSSSEISELSESVDSD